MNYDPLPRIEVFKRLLGEHKREREFRNELFRQIMERHERESHQMGRDVPYWVEDFLNVGVEFLETLWRFFWKSSVIALIVAALYEVYAVLNGLPRLSRHMTVNIWGNVMVIGSVAAAIRFAWFPIKRVKPQ